MKWENNSCIVESFTDKYISCKCKYFTGLFSIMEYGKIDKDILETNLSELIVRMDATQNDTTFNTTTQPSESDQSSITTIIMLIISIFLTLLVVSFVIYKCISRKILSKNNIKFNTVPATPLNDFKNDDLEKTLSEVSTDVELAVLEDSNDSTKDK